MTLATFSDDNSTLSIANTHDYYKWTQTQIFY